MAFEPGEIISYTEMCATEGASLQRGMNYKLNPLHSVILMSRRPGAPYEDVIEDDGRILIYEGHDAPKRRDGPDPKAIDQPEYTPGGTPTQNRLFREAAARYRTDRSRPELVRVYEKLRQGIWVFNGLFRLVDSWDEHADDRRVIKFRLEVSDVMVEATSHGGSDVLEHTRMIPPAVKQEVYKRDGGRCVTCGSVDNLHFDHVLPFSKGGTSLSADNIQLLCARHNLVKSAKIQ